MDDGLLYPTTSFRIGLRSGHSASAGQNRAIRGTTITISSPINTSRAVGMATTATLDPIV